MSQPWQSATPAIFCNLADGNLGNLGNLDQLGNTLVHSPKVWLTGIHAYQVPHLVGHFGSIMNDGGQNG